MSCWAVPRPVRSMLWLFYNPDISVKLVLQSSWLSGLKSMELPRVFRYLAPNNPTRPGCLSGFLRFQHQLLHIKESFYSSQKMEHNLLGLMTAGESMLHPLSKLEDSGKKSAVCQSSLGILRLIAVNGTGDHQENLVVHFFCQRNSSPASMGPLVPHCGSGPILSYKRSSAFEAWANVPGEQGLVIFSEHPFKGSCLPPTWWSLENQCRMNPSCYSCSPWCWVSNNAYNLAPTTFLPWVQCGAAQRGWMVLGRDFAVPPSSPSLLSRIWLQQGGLCVWWRLGGKSN